MKDNRLLQIIEQARQGQRLSKDDCAYMLNIPAWSEESGLIRAASDALIRKKNNNAAIVIGQIGVDIHPCNANCKFCSFGESHTGMPRMRIDKETLKQKIEEFARHDDLYGLYLMTMADYEKDFLLETVSYAKSVIPGKTQIWVNTGDGDRSFYEELKEAGCCGAYHVWRLREGEDTALDPKTRYASMQNIVDAGLQLFSCVEPIGPEHTVEELADAIDRCIDLGVTQYGAMRRIAVPGSPLYHYGQISNLQMAHVMGCVGLAYACVPSARFFGVHEPCEAGYLAGANFVTAETGANPRDTVQDTSQGRGWDMGRCRELLFDCGFDKLLRGDETSITLDYDYLVKTDSLV